MAVSPTIRRRYTLGLAFACFLTIGVVNGLLGVAWPSIRDTFGLPLDAIVFLLTSTTIGFVSGSLLAGSLMNRFGIALFLLMMNILAALGVIGYALAPSWWLFVFLGLIVGFASGAIDTGLNIYVAATRTVRTMNWMHAMFGVGATMGPLIMTAAIGSGIGWRVGYGITSLFHLGLGLLYITVLNTLAFRRMEPVSLSKDGQLAQPVPSLVSIRIPVVLFGILLFLLYTGVESSTGQWSYSLFTESRNVSAYIGGVMTSVFWAMLTLGRMIFGAAANRIGVKNLLRWSMIGAIASAVLFLFRNQYVGFAAVAFMGLSLSAIFPTLTSDTPNRVGSEHAASAIGFQTGAASVGFAILPGLAGGLAARTSLEILGPFLIVASILMFLTNELTMWLVERSHRRKEVATNPV